MKKDNGVSIGPKIGKGAADFYKEFFGKINPGATWVLEEFPHLFRITLVEMRGRFTAGELSMILDVLNGNIMLASGAHGLAGQHVLLSVADSFDLYPGMYEDKWDLEKVDFLDKLGSLSRFQATCLELWAAGFWEKYQETTVEEYCKSLL